MTEGAKPHILVILNPQSLAALLESSLMPAHTTSLSSDQLREFVSREFEVEILKLTDEARFNEDLGFDSVAMFDLVVYVESLVDSEHDLPSVPRIVTFADLARYFQELQR